MIPFRTTHPAPHIKDLQPFGKDKVAIPYSGTIYPHKFPRWQAVFDAANMGWAWWQKDRLCAVTTDDEGEFWTVPNLPSARQIRLNFRAPMAGKIRVGIEDVVGRSVSGCPSAERTPVVGQTSMLAHVDSRRNSRIRFGRRRQRAFDPFSVGHRQAIRITRPKPSNS